MLEFLQDLMGRLLGRRGRLGLVAAATTDRGLVRADNQDSFVCTPEEGFLCVADGMGGGEGGALASRWACEALQEAWMSTRGKSLDLREHQVLEALQSANGRIRAYAKSKGFKVMGTTAAAFLHECEDGFRARIFHVGDSRVYRYRLGRLDVLTRDHTVGNELGAAMSAASSAQAKSLQARSNPLTHILTRAVGTELRARPEWKTVDLQKGDRFMLCSDGVHDMLSDVEIAAALKESSSPRAAVARIETAVRKAGAGDNYTIVCGYVVVRHR